MRRPLHSSPPNPRQGRRSLQILPPCQWTMDNGQWPIAALPLELLELLDKRMPVLRSERTRLATMITSSCRSLVQFDSRSDAREPRAGGILRCRRRAEQKPDGAENETGAPDDG